LGKVVQQLPLCMLSRVPSTVDLGALVFIASYQAFVRHDLHEFQDGGVPRRLNLVQDGLDLTY
jgi:hypothetical protein